MQPIVGIHVCTTKLKTYVDALVGVAAVKLARKLGPGHRIVTILCDSGTRHLSKFWKEAGNVGDEAGLRLEQIVRKTN